MGGILGLLGGTLSAASGLITNELNRDINARNRAHEINLMGLQNQYAQQNAQMADERTRKLYMELQSPGAIAQQIQDAGLSLGLLYGNGSMGGQMQGGAQADTPTPTNRGTIPMQNILDAQTANIIATAEKTAAETENIKENTKKTEAEAASTWKDLDLKTKQLVIMENQIKQIQQSIKESEQKVDNMIAEKANILQQNNNLKAAEELTKAQKEYQESLKKLTDIQIEWEPAKQKATLENLKALTQQYKAAAAKLRAEADLTKAQKDLLDKQAENLCKKLASEVLMAEYQQKEIQPKEYDKLVEEINAIQLNSWGENQRKHFYEQFNRSGEGSGDFLRILFEDIDIWPM